MLFSLLNVLILFTNVFSHVSFYPNTIPYSSYSTRFSLKIPHACSENSTNMIKTAFPDGFSLKPEFKQGWTTTLMSDGMSNNISWVSNNVSNNIPAGFNELFWIWITTPQSYTPNIKYYVPTIQNCYPSGEYKWTATPTITGQEQAPYFIVASTPTLAPTSFEDNSNKLSSHDIFFISISVISILSLVMNFFNEYRYFNDKTLKTNTDTKQVQMLTI